ncbi:MAG: helix-turn-helix domain-containing protein [Anaerolineae bacterium]
MTKISVLHIPQERDKGYPFWVGTLEDAPPFALSNELRRHTFYLAVWVTSGSGQHIVDFEKENIRPKTLFFVRPGQVQQWLIDQPVTGHYCVFDEEIFQVLGAHQFFKELSFLAPFANPTVCLADDSAQAGKIQHFFEEISTAFQSADWGHGVEVLAWLQLLCIYTEREFEKGRPEQTLSPGQQITQDFLRLADSEATHEHNLSFYANQIGVTIGHLTGTVKAVYGISAGEMLRSRLMLEAKRLLAHTELTMAEIAEQLNYADPSYFGRAFKRDIGQTPRSFRQEFRKT